jgi:hypothetical protein
MRTTYIAIVLLAAGALVATGGESQQPRSLDDQLLDELSVEPLGELDRELFAPGDTGQEPQETPDEAAEELGDRLRRELGAAAVSEEENPLLEVARQMREVEGRIGVNDSGPATQSIQGQIVATLDELINQTGKACQESGSSKPCSGGGQPKSGRPGTTPGEGPAATSRLSPEDKDRQAARGEMQAMMQQLWEVGLPAHQRDQLLQSPFEEFLPEYELLIERYFRRLSEEEE